MFGVEGGTSSWVAALAVAPFSSWLSSSSKSPEDPEDEFAVAGLALTAPDAYGGTCYHSVSSSDTEADHCRYEGGARPS